MRKFLLFTFLICLNLHFANALPIDIEQAKMKAKQFYEKKYSDYNGRKKVKQIVKLDLLYVEEDNNDALFYVFSNGGTGFIIVSAEDDLQECILGYSLTGRFCVDSIPADARYWLKSYGEQISLLRNRNIILSQRNNVQREYIAPMTTSQWDQYAPYNGKCPTYNDIDHCLVGCTPVAFAQLMYYYKWPGRGSGVCALNTTVEGKNVSITEDFSKTTYQWDKMQDTYAGVSSRASKTAVATLMYHMGIIGRATWGKENTSAYPYYSAEGLNQYFGYKKFRKLEKKSYTNNAWADTIYSELQQGRPVIYTGDSRTSGHCFICDGYENGYFHMNWGWGGYCDGFFLLTALTADPSNVSRYSFDYNQIIYIGIEPNYEQSNNQYFVLYPDRVTLGKYENTKLYIKILSDQLTENDIIWHSSDEGTVKVTQDGTVTALKEGEADIYAEVSGRPDTQQTCRITVISSSLVSPPKASIDPGKVLKNTKLFLTTDEEYGLIYYTKDGTSPFFTNENRLLFVNNIVLDKDVVIAAQAFDLDGNGSEIVSFAYDVQLHTPKASVESGVVYKGTTVKLTTEDKDVDIYYTTDGTLPTDPQGTRKKYNEAFLIDRDMELKICAVDEFDNSDVVTYTYDLQLHTPKASVESGVVYKGTTVKLTTVDKDVDIYYTTDGTLPTDPRGTRKKYNEAFLIDRDMELKICAVDEFDNSDVVTYTYDLQLRTPKASVESGVVYKGTTVKISTEDKDVDIYYTTDGTLPTDPKGTRKKYGEPIVIDWDLELSYYSKDLFNESPIGTCSYVVPKTIYHLSEGWNWVSFAEKTPKLRNVTEMLSSGVWNSVDEVKNGLYSDSFSEMSNKWIGSLTSNGGFDNRSMYMLHTSVTQDVVMFHTPETDWATDEITITPYWNYISYLPPINMSVNEALANYDAIDGDIIKSQDGFAIYSPQKGWTGSLDSLEVSHGYMLKRSPAGRWTSFTYPPVSSSNRRSKAKEREGHRYAQNMSIIANIISPDIKAGDELIAFSMGEEMIGRCKVLENLPCFLTIEGDTLTNYYYAIVRNGNVMYKSNRMYTYIPNDIVGTLEEPASVIFTDIVSDFIHVYPKVISSDLRIEIDLYGENTISVSLYDISGRMISQPLLNNYFVDKGTYCISLTTLRKGIYFVKVVVNGQTKESKEYKITKK